MSQSHVGSSLRGHRKRSGLEQKEVAWILGLPNEEQASRHEFAKMIPTLQVALGYEVLFGVTARELFPRFYEGVRRQTEQKLAKLEQELQQLNTKGRKATAVARKLEFLCCRKNPASIDFENEWNSTK